MTAPRIDEREGLEEFSSFLGLRNNVNAEAFERGDLVTALNVDIDDANKIRRRRGHSAVLTAAVDRSLWAEGAMCLGVGSNALKRIHPNYTATILRTGLSADRPLAYAAVGGRIYYSNGVEQGCVEANGTHRTWGLTVPTIPLAVATGGTLRAGKYQYAVTYLRNDGQESGTRLAGTIELTDTSGISLSSISVSTDSTVNTKAIYTTPVNGETLFLTGTISNSTPTYIIRETRTGANPLRTQFLSPPPAGDYLAYWKGWMLVGRGTYLYVSEPYAPELFDLRKSYPFLDNLTMLAATGTRSEGVWVGTENQVIWLGGSSPETWQPDTIADYGVIPGALWVADGELLGDKAHAGTPVAFFATTRGLCAGLSDGTFHNLTQDRYAYPSMDRGACVVRRHQGMAQMLATLQGTEVAGNVIS